MFELSLFNADKLRLWAKSILVLPIFVISCDDFDDATDLAVNDYLIFGHFYGECSGEGCIEIFKLENGSLFEDTQDIYPNAISYYRGNYMILNVDTFNGVNDLTTFFPLRLLGENDRIIGRPDAGDWGGLYIEYNVNGTRKFWLIDQKKDNVPPYLHTFIDKVNEKIRFINNKGRCGLAPQSGNCEAAIPKYYYDPQDGECKEFIWGGCDGVVPFHTLQDCRECLSD
ncbi:BPTI/Kunitz domain-containing protein [Maribacter algicola]|uniref:BPTI/Kunitz domain-containing protein n=1 Tax=Meishania litoralis TaxID=3434685 RepID=A0ACC7LJY9_9FLAO